MATGPTPRIAAVRDWVGTSAPFVVRDDPVRGSIPVEVRRPRWPAARLAAVETLWGEGYTAPGGADGVRVLAEPLSLTPEDKLLLLGGGRGGPACTLATGCGASIANYEAEAELAELARGFIAAHVSGTRIVVERWNPQFPDFGIRAADHALLLEALRGADPVRILDSLAASLRPQSRIVMTEMVADLPAPNGDREFAAWCRLENREPVLPRGEAITAALARLRYDVRVVEDISGAHVGAALAGWRQAARAMADGPMPSPEAASAVVTEAELWLLRIRVMRRFGLRLLRWHAVGPAGRLATA